MGKGLSDELSVPGQILLQRERNASLDDNLNGSTFKERNLLQREQILLRVWSPVGLLLIFFFFYKS